MSYLSERNEKLKKIYFDTRNFFKQGITPIYHGVKFEYLENIFQNEEIESRTFHRYWKDGLRRKENWDNYKDSCWKYGWCLSRDIEIALNFGCVVFVFDKAKLKEDFIVEPFAWNYHFSDTVSIVPNHKKEREEFVVSKKTELCETKRESEIKQWGEDILELERFYKKMPKETTEDKSARRKLNKQIKQLKENPPMNFHKELDTPHGKSLDLKKHLIGFYINQSRYDIAMKYNDDSIKQFFDKLEEHPLFLGYLKTENNIAKTIKNKLKM